MPETQQRCGIFSSCRPLQLAAVFLMLMSLLFSIGWITNMEPRHLNSLRSRFGYQDELGVKMASRHKGRTQRIEEYCAKYGTKTSWKELDFSNFIVVEKYKMVYCSVPKVACTTWKRILAKLEGWNITTGVHKYSKDKLKFLQNYSLQDQRKILNTYTKFMFVREPFERLLSGYRDCFWGQWKRKQASWKQYRRNIGRLLQRGAGMKINIKADNITFAEFATFLVLRWRTGGTFQEHWREQYKLCHPCNIHYDVVGHYETFLEDAQFILKKTKTERKVSLPSWQPTDTNVLQNSYYSSLSLLRIAQLEQIYMRDFELFGYSRPGPLGSVVKKLKQVRL